jgi:signal transduction histidine kinase/ActR/RegA family two-component response regulator
VVRTRHAQVGFLVGRSGSHVVPVRVPVIRGGSLRYVLSALIQPKAIASVLDQTQFDDQWLVSVADANGMRVARTRSPDQSLGTPFSPTLVEIIRRQGHEGHGETRSSEGERVISAFVRAPGSGWITAVGSSPLNLEAGARRSFYTLGGGILLSLLLGGMAALLIAGSIARPMAPQLRDSAVRLGRREKMALPHTALREVHDVGQALVAAEAERGQAEAAREALLESEKAARSAAESANRAKDEFLAMLGHELRNPLGAIANAAHLVEHPQAPPESKREALAIINRQVAHLKRMTDDLLDAGRAVMGKIVLQRRPVDLAAIARNTLATLEASGRTRRHRVVESLEPAWIDADPVRLDQILGNLVTNAVKYTPEAGRIHVSVAREGGEAVLRVADEGIGIAPDLAPRVFDLFVQGERPLDRSQGGLGIGLTLVRRLAELHGGAASVQSDGDGRGSTFIVRFPAIEAPAAAAPAQASARKGAGRDILVVEDNDDARESLRVLLEISGHRVKVARDGREGLEMALRERPEVVLLDVGLPELNGYQVARRLRADAGWSRRPLLIAVTGYGQPADHAAALEAGFDAHMAKPLELDVLNDVLARSAPTS